MCIIITKTSRISILIIDNIKLIDTKKINIQIKYDNEKYLYKIIHIITKILNNHEQTIVKQIIAVFHFLSTKHRKIALKSDYKNEDR